MVYIYGLCMAGWPRNNSKIRTKCTVMALYTAAVLIPAAYVDCASNDTYTIVLRVDTKMLSSN